MATNKKGRPKGVMFSPEETLKIKSAAAEYPSIEQAAKSAGCSATQLSRAMADLSVVSKKMYFQLLAWSGYIFEKQSPWLADEGFFADWEAFYGPAESLGTREVAGIDVGRLPGGELVDVQLSLDQLGFWGWPKSVDDDGRELFNSDMGYELTEEAYCLFRDFVQNRDHKRRDPIKYMRAKYRLKDSLERLKEVEGISVFYHQGEKASIELPSIDSEQAENLSTAQLVPKIKSRPYIHLQLVKELPEEKFVTSFAEMTHKKEPLSSPFEIKKFYRPNFIVDRFPLHKTEAFNIIYAFLKSTLKKSQHSELIYIDTNGRVETYHSIEEREELEIDDQTTLDNYHQIHYMEDNSGIY